MVKKITLQGVNEDFLFRSEPEIVLAGNYESGKTTAILKKIHFMCEKYPKARVLIARGQLKHLETTTLFTYESTYMQFSGIEKRRTSTGYLYTYPNGSTILGSALFKNQEVPNHLLACEFDIAYIPHIEDIQEEPWELILSRTAGRSMNTPYSQVIGELSYVPGYNDNIYKEHWIHNRKNAIILQTKLKDNPVLYDFNTKQKTVQGEKTEEALKKLSYGRIEKEFSGQWIS